MAISIDDKFQPNGNFPLVDAEHVQYEAGKSMKTAFLELQSTGGGDLPAYMYFGLEKPLVTTKKIWYKPKASSYLPVPYPAIWFDASKLALEPDTPIEILTNLGEKPIELIQEVEEKQPLFKVDENGKSYIEFTGTQFLLGQFAEEWSIEDRSQFTIFAVADIMTPSSTSGSAVLFGLGKYGTSSASDSRAITFKRESRENGEYKFSVHINNESCVVTSNDSVVMNSTNIIYSIYDLSSYKLYLNGVYQNELTFNDYARPITGMSIGRDVRDANYIAMKFREVLIYSKKVFTEEQISKTLDYLNTKWKEV